MWLLVSAHTSLHTPLSMSPLLLTLNHVVAYFSSVIATPHMTVTYVTYGTGPATNDSGDVVHKGSHLCNPCSLAEYPTCGSFGRKVTPDGPWEGKKGESDNSGNI